MADNRQHFVTNSSLSRRSIGAIFVFIPTTVTAVLGGWWFTGLVLVMALVAAREMVELARLAGFAPSRASGLVACLMGFVLALWPNQALFSVPATVLLLASLAWQICRNTPRPISDWAMPLAGGLYIGWCSGHLAALRMFANGAWWLVVAIGATWVSDSGAYFVGRRIGKHKLAPAISPRKTWEGYFGGVATGTMFGVLISIWSPLGMLNNVLACLAVSMVGTLGDLAESMFKRQANAKDSGILIPGQGGAFDRLDSLLWSGVAVWLYATVVAGATNA